VGWLLTYAAAILTCWHLIFATAATQILARTTTLLDGRKTVKMTGRVYLRAIVPIGLLYSASLVCSNMVYMYLSVAFIQMLKSAAPVAVLLIGWAWGIDSPSMKRFLNVLVIVFGVALASMGEIDFSLVGFLYQLGGIVFEAMRLVMIQILLAGDGQKMDPLVSLYYFAPVCAVMNVLIAGLAEGPRFDFGDVAKAGYLILLLNAMVAFMLNVASVSLVSGPVCPQFISLLTCLIDWQDVKSRHDAHRYLEEYPARHCIRHHMEYIHQFLAVCWLRGCARRPCLLLSRLGANRQHYHGLPCMVQGSLGLTIWRERSPTSGSQRSFYGLGHHHLCHAGVRIPVRIWSRCHEAIIVSRVVI